MVLWVNRRVGVLAEWEWVKRKEMQRIHESTVQNTKYDCLGPAENYPVSCSHNKLIHLHPCSSEKDQKLLLSCLSVLAGWLNARSSHLNQRKSETWRRGSKGTAGSHSRLSPAPINTRRSTHSHNSNSGGAPEWWRPWVPTSSLSTAPPPCQVTLFIFKCL